MEVFSRTESSRVLRGVAGFLAVIAVLVVPAGNTATPAKGAAGVRPADAAVSGRIAYAGTGHRSLGAVTDPVPGQPSPTVPVFGDGPTHFDDQGAARGGLLVFTSLRDGPRPQVYLRAADGSVRRLTSDRDAGHPQLSPDLRSVVFDSAEPDPGGQDTGTAQHDLWLVGVDGTGLRRLTTTAGDEIWPTFAPDGVRIAFSYDQDGSGHRQIYDMPVSGGAARQLTDEPSGAAIEPAWNPVDRTLLAYTLDADGNLADDSDQSIRIRHGEGNGGPLFEGARSEWQTRWPAWKPDGRALLFLSLDQNCDCPRDTVDRVYQTDLSGGAPATSEPQLLLDENRSVDSPTWLSGSGGDRLVVARTTAPARNVGLLTDIRPDGTDPRSLGLSVLAEDPDAATDSLKLFDPGPGSDPWTVREAYSPDGRQIAVSRFETVGDVKSERIWLVDADGSNAHPLSIQDRKPGDWETDQAWSPDGRFLAFARRSPGAPNREGGASHVVIVRVDTGQVTGTVRNPDPTADEDDTQPAWSPDGTTLAFSRGTVAGGPEGQSRTNHIWTARAGTLDRQRDLSAAVCGSDCQVTDDSSAFAPDGRSLAFNREGDGLLRVFLADDRCQVMLPVGQTSCAGPLHAPGGPFQPRDIAWSPDGSQAVVTTRRNEGPNSPEGLAILDPANGTLRPVDWELPGRQKEPTWQAAVDLTVTAPATVPAITVGTGTTVGVTVTNQGPSPSPGTELSLSVPDGLRLDDLRTTRGSCDPAALRCSFGILEPGDQAQATVAVTGVGPGEDRLVFSAAGTVLDPQPGDNSAGTVVPVVAMAPPSTVVPPPPLPAPPAPPPPRAGPGLAVAIQPDPSYVGGRATVTYSARNGNNALATGLRLDFGLPAGIPVASVPPGCTITGCPLPDLPPGSSATLQVVLAPNTALTATVVGRLETTGTDADPADNVATATLRVLQPRIIAVPPIGKPGFVTLVRGVDFPPGTPVGLVWTPGITAAAAPTLPGADGRFTAQLLILTKDQTGPRIITASGAGFAPVTTPFLVVTGTIAPPDMVRRD
ncbi:hypothetical protein [Amycolatopsis pigmentata]|uniref:DUF11 domain-containing protein n=1 Tax=Amycolatopsis pigmentata TaxID=450801 RepID=A0ABW5FP28_9PSEU